MKKSLFAILGSISLVLVFMGISKALPTGLKSYVPGEQDRVVKIDFTVDLLDRIKNGVLEVAFKETGYMRYVVELQPDSSGTGAKGKLQATAPASDLTLVTCARVQCSLEKEMEIVCGESRIPSWISIVKTHQIKFLASRACANASDSDTFAKGE